MNQPREVLLFTTESLPDTCKITEMFSMVIVTRSVRVTQQNLLARMFAPGTNDYAEALNLLRNQAPSQANAIIGVRHATAIHTFGDGTVMMLTLTGTPCEFVSGQ